MCRAPTSIIGIHRLEPSLLPARMYISKKLVGSKGEGIEPVWEEGAPTFGVFTIVLSAHHRYCTILRFVMLARILGQSYEQVLGKG